MTLSERPSREPSEPDQLGEIGDFSLTVTFHDFCRQIIADESVRAELREEARRIVALLEGREATEAGADDEMPLNRLNHPEAILEKAAVVDDRIDEGERQAALETFTEMLDHWKHIPAGHGSNPDGKRAIASARQALDRSFRRVVKRRQKYTGNKEVSRQEPPEHSEEWKMVWQQLFAYAEKIDTELPGGRLLIRHSEHDRALAFADTILAQTDDWFFRVWAHKVRATWDCQHSGNHLYAAEQACREAGAAGLAFETMEYEVSHYLDHNDRDQALVVFIRMLDTWHGLYPDERVEYIDYRDHTEHFLRPKWGMERAYKLVTSRRRRRPA